MFSVVVLPLNKVVQLLPGSDDCCFTAKPESQNRCTWRQLVQIKQLVWRKLCKFTFSCEPKWKRLHTVRSGRTEGAAASSGRVSGSLSGGCITCTPIRICFCLKPWKQPEGSRETFWIWNIQIYLWPGLSISATGPMCCTDGRLRWRCCRLTEWKL